MHPIDLILLYIYLAFSYAGLCRVLAKISKMPVLNSNSHNFACPDLATNELLHIPRSATFNRQVYLIYINLSCINSCLGVTVLVANLACTFKVGVFFKKIFSLYLFWRLQQSEQRHLYVEI